MYRRLTGCLLLLNVSLSALSAAGAETAPVQEPPGKSAAPTDLLDGALWRYSVDGGRTFSAEAPIIKAESAVQVTAMTEFDVPDTAGLVVLELTHGLPTTPRSRLKFTLNGKAVKPPVDGMRYRTIPAIDAKMLKKGRNVLAAEVTLDNVSSRRHEAKDYPFKVKMRLAALRSEHLKIKTGPILGAFDKDYFTVTCRTNMPTTINAYWRGTAKNGLTLAAGGGKPGLIHRLKVPVGESPENAGRLIVADDLARASAAVGYPPQPAGETLRFVAVGDSRTNPDDWAKVAASVVKTKPDLIVFSGDMVTHGRNDWEWDEQFFGQAKDLFATIPLYAVIGNHEQNAPIFNELFYTPGGKEGKARNWSQQINGVALIGIDGQEDWSAGSQNALWLERTLIAVEDSGFVFLFSHYPGWTSSSHGRLDEKTNRPSGIPVRQSQDVIVPLLSKYGATAMVCGHDHVYERSELPGGLTQIVSGGAGAPLRGKSEDAARQNPYSTVFASALHYCIFEVKGDTCTMKAVTPDGEIIDTRVWKARKVGR